MLYPPVDQGCEQKQILATPFSILMKQNWRSLRIWYFRKESLKLTCACSFFSNFQRGVFELQSLLALRFETKGPRSHAKVKPFDLFFLERVLIPHTYMKAKVPCTGRWPPVHTLSLFVPASPPMMMRYCTRQLYPAWSIFILSTAPPLWS